MALGTYTMPYRIDAAAEYRKNQLPDIAKYIMKFFFLVFAIFLSQPAWAYVDPGTGAMMIQGLLALIAAVSVALRKYWARVKSWFGGAKEHAADENKKS